MIAGLDYSRGDGIICMDADLQHPPECIPDILAKFEEGYQVINMVRTKNRTAGLVKNITSSGFYWLINRISDVHFEANASDFFAVSRHVAQVLKNSYREKVRFLRGYVQNVALRKPPLSMKQGPGGRGEQVQHQEAVCVFHQYNPVLFQHAPEAWYLRRHILGLLGLAVMIYTLCTRKGAPSGYATIVVLICFMFAMMFVIIGIIGEYIAILFTELKDRPVYIVDRTENIVQGENAD